MVLVERRPAQASSISCNHIVALHLFKREMDSVFMSQIAKMAIETESLNLQFSLFI